LFHHKDVMNILCEDKLFYQQVKMIYRFLSPVKLKIFLL